MKTGMLERILIKRYGPPVNAIIRGLPAHGWNPDEFNYACALYMGMNWQSMEGLRFASLKEIYGNSIGGYLIKNTLKAAILPPREIYGIWNIDDLRVHPNLQRGIVMDPRIDYFMEYNNTHFYGIKGDQLYLFDWEYDEIEPLGPIEPALEEVFDDLAAAFLEPMDSDV